MSYSTENQEQTFYSFVKINTFNSPSLSPGLEPWSDQTLTQRRILFICSHKGRICFKHWGQTPGVTSHRAVLTSVSQGHSFPTVIWVLVDKQSECCVDLYYYLYDWYYQRFCLSTKLMHKWCAVNNINIFGRNTFPVCYGRMTHSGFNNCLYVEHFHFPSRINKLFLNWRESSLLNLNGLSMWSVLVYSSSSWWWSARLPPAVKTLTAHSLLMKMCNRTRGSSSCWRLYMDPRLKFCRESATGSFTDIQG